MTPVVASEDIAVLPAGPGADVLVAETARRMGVDLLAGPPSLAVEAELFAGLRVDLSLDESLTATAAWKPDLIVHEHYDFVGPLVGTVLDIPVATLAYGPAMVSGLAEATAVVAASRYEARGVVRRPSRWYLDTCPQELQHDGWRTPDGRIALRPEAHVAPGRPASTPAIRERRRPRVLVTFGTVFNAPHMLTPLLHELVACDVDLCVTTGLLASAADFDIVSDRVTFVGFTPLDELLRDVDVVLTHGGAGTTLGTLAAGIPLVVAPLGADQFVQADRVAAARAGIAVTPIRPGALADALTSVLGDPSFRDNARKIAAQIAALPSPADVASDLAAALGNGR
jgi:hypothetical protein